MLRASLNSAFSLQNHQPWLSWCYKNLIFSRTLLDAFQPLEKSRVHLLIQFILKNDPSFIASSDLTSKLKRETWFLLLFLSIYIGFTLISVLLPLKSSLVQLLVQFSHSWYVETWKNPSRNLLDLFQPLNAICNFDCSVLSHLAPGLEHYIFWFYHDFWIPGTKSNSVTYFLTCFLFEYRIFADFLVF